MWETAVGLVNRCPNMSATQILFNCLNRIKKISTGVQRKLKFCCCFGVAQLRDILKSSCLTRTWLSAKLAWERQSWIVPNYFQSWFNFPLDKLIWENPQGVICVSVPIHVKASFKCIKVVVGEIWAFLTQKVSRTQCVSDLPHRWKNKHKGREKREAERHEEEAASV